MKIYDVSMKLSAETIVYPGDPKIRLKKSVSEDSVFSTVSMGLHSGTHVDAPEHFLPKGKSIDKVPLERLCGPACVLDLSSVEKEIAGPDLSSKKIKKGDVVLLKTKNQILMERKSFSKSFVHIGCDAAKYLAERKIKAVGIDYLSVDGFKSETHPAHKTLLKNSIPIIEGLDLRKIRPGRYDFYCLPLRFVGVEAAPARCVLMK